MAMPSRATAFQHYASDRLELAERAARDFLAAAPGDFDTINLLAVICCRRGDLQQGIGWTLQVLERRPDDVQALELLGDALHALNECSGAAEAFRRATTAAPAVARLHAKHGYALHAAGRLAEAVEAYAAAIAARSVDPGLYMDMGKALARLGRLAEAAQAFRQAVVGDPELGLAWVYLGEVLGRTGELEEACAAYRKALAFRPDDADAWFNLGRHLNDLGRPAEALDAFDQALRSRPDFVDAHSNRSAALRQLGRIPEAARAAREALRHDPDHANALSNLGNALTALGRLDAALVAHLRAIERAPTRGALLANLSLTLQERGAESDAIAVLEQAVALDPTKAWPQFNLALIRLKNGDFDRGWSGYDWRWKAKNRGTRADPRRQPAWNGGSVPDGRLMIWSEQGIGDEIMFAGLLGRLMERGIRCAVECDPRLQPLFIRSFPDATFVARGGGGLPTDVAAHVHAGDLPGLLRSDRGPEPWLATNYLTADPAQTAALRRRYDRGAPIVGIAWYSANMLTGTRRSIPVAQLRALLGGLGVTWVSLQYGELDKMRGKLGPDLAIDPEIDQMTDMDRFAAQVAAMDLVVTIDNSTAHLAGALGRPTILALSSDADWRWMRGRDDTPWYPSLRLIRQQRAGDWSDVIQGVRTAIMQHGSNRTRPAPMNPSALDAATGEARDDGPLQDQADGDRG